MIRLWFNCWLLFSIVFSFENKLIAEEFVISEKTKNFYETGVEKDRLEQGMGRIEKARTEIILDTFLPKPPATIIDVGGGTGVYSFFLSKKGYSVYLIDPVRANIEEAKKIGQEVNVCALKDYIVGDARKMAVADQKADVVLFFGPLYHLDRHDRHIALTEAYRVLKGGGRLFAVAVSRFVPLSKFLRKRKMSPDLEQAIDSSLSTGQFEYRGCPFFSLYPDELKTEIEEVGFKEVSLHAIEGAGSLLNDDDLEDEMVRKKFLAIAGQTEGELSTMGWSNHFMAIGTKPTECKD